MDKKTLLIPLALLALGLSSCVPESSSSSSSAGSAGGSSSDSNVESGSSSIPVPDIRTDIDQEFLDRLSSSSLSFSGTMDVDGSLSSVQGFIGKESYSFHGHISSLVQFLNFYRAGSSDYTTTRRSSLQDYCLTRSAFLKIRTIKIYRICHSR